MDFFEAQEKARRKTKWLVFYFVLAVLGTIVASYVAARVILSQTGGPAGRSHRSSAGYPYSPATADGWWDPQLFALVAGGTVLVVGLASAYKWAAFRQGGSAVAESVGGRRLDAHSTDTRERRLLNVVEEMAIASGVPVPAVYVLDDEPALNAFAAGLTTNDAVIAVTRGTLEKLNRDELQGVIAHEFSHILNGDMRLNVKLTAIIFGILVIGLIGRGILQGLGRGRVRLGGGKNKGGGLALILAIGVALLIIGYVGYFFGRLIQAAVSRQREFLADAASVQFTRNPAGITGALKKIGGYALGSRLDTRGAEQLGHFFFAQGFSSFFGSLWATHPPLDERIRTIDAGWDGKFVEPPEVVDVAKESFVSAGLAPPLVSAPFAAAPGNAGRRDASVTPQGAVAAIGALVSENVAAAQTLLAGLPGALRTAAQSPTAGPALVCGLLLEPAEGPVRSHQRNLIASRGGSELLQMVDALVSPLADLRAEQKLALLQIALPALRQLPPSAVAPLLQLTDQLVDADNHVSTFEFALKSFLRRTLARGRAPASAGAQVWSFDAVAEPIAVVLSTLASATCPPSDQNTEAGRAAAGIAFLAGAAQLRMLEGRLQFLGDDRCDLTRFDEALDRLVVASGPIKQRVLTAAANIVSADGVIRTEEYELMRVIAFALDCPMPPLAAAAA